MSRRSIAPAAVVAEGTATAATGRAILGSQAPAWDPRPRGSRIAAPAVASRSEASACEPIPDPRSRQTAVAVGSVPGRPDDGPTGVHLGEQRSQRKGRVHQLNWLTCQESCTCRDHLDGGTEMIRPPFVWRERRSSAFFRKTAASPSVERAGPSPASAHRQRRRKPSRTRGRLYLRPGDERTLQ